MLLANLRALLQQKPFYPFESQQGRPGSHATLRFMRNALLRNLVVDAAKRYMTKGGDPPLANVSNQRKKGKSSFRPQDQRCLTREKSLSKKTGLTLGDKLTACRLSNTVKQNRSLAKKVKKKNADKIHDKQNELSLEKQMVIQLVLDGASLFIGGEAGTGKSFLLRHIIRELKSMGLHVAVTASTGLAALRIGGNTFHSTFGVPIFSEDDGNKVKGRNITSLISFDLDSLTNTDVIIVDEVSLLHAGHIEALDLAARAAPGRAPHMPFGGIQIILVGDFMQLMPGDMCDDGNKDHVISKKQEKKSTLLHRTVNKKRKRDQGELLLEDTYDATRPISTRSGCNSLSIAARHRRMMFYHNRPVFENPVFQHCLLHLRLCSVVRQAEDPEFLQDLKKLRHGVLTYRLAHSAFLNPEDPNAIRLFPKKRAVTAFNNAKLLEIDGEERCFRTHLRVKSCFGTELTSNMTCDKKKRNCPDVLVIHFRDKPAHSKKWFQLAEELVYRLASRHDLSDFLKVNVLPIPSLHSRHLCLCIRFLEQTGGVYVNALEKLQHALHLEFFSGTKAATAAQKIWGMVSLEVRRVDFMERFVRSLFERKYAKSIQNEHTLQHKRLKVGCRVMLLRNLNTKYVNGSLGTVVRFQHLRHVRHLLPTNLKVMLSGKMYKCLRKPLQKPSSMELQLETFLHRPNNDMSNVHTDQEHDNTSVDDDKDGTDDSDSNSDTIIPVIRIDSDGTEVAIPWVSMPLPQIWRSDICNVQIFAMPLIPAYAYTVHKVQGLTFDCPVLFDGKGFFPCNHIIYVAASRVKRFSSFRMVNVSHDMVMVHRGALQFSSSVPSVDEAMKMWKRRKRKKGCRPAIQGASLPQDLTLYPALWKLRLVGRNGRKDVKE